MSRHFPDFLAKYTEYAKGDSIPDFYNLWSGLSLIASVAQRKVWTVDDSRIGYPNLYVLLVGKPGAGKSQSIGKAQPLIYTLQRKIGVDYKLIEGVATQAGVMSNMNILVKNPDGSLYSPIYITGDEGSDSALKNHADDFRATATAMYDCKELFQKTLKDKQYNIPNPVMNMLVGTTYDFLKTVVNENSVMGGLASRLTYVVDEKEISGESKLDVQSVFYDPEAVHLLTEDLLEMYKMRGKFKFEKSALDLHSQWYRSYAEEVNEMTSERLRSIHVRRPFLLTKLFMLFSMSEREDLGVTATQMEKAIATVDRVTRDYASIVSSAIIGNKTTQDSINQFILQGIKKAGGIMPSFTLKSNFMGFGGDPSKLEGTLSMMDQAKMIERDLSAGTIKLLVDPDSYL